MNESSWGILFLDCLKIKYWKDIAQTCLIELTLFCHAQLRLATFVYLRLNANSVEDHY